VAVAAVQSSGLDVCSGVRTNEKLDAAELQAFTAAIEPSAASVGDDVFKKGQSP